MSNEQAPPTPTNIDNLVAWSKWHPCSKGTHPKRHNHSFCQAGELIVRMLDTPLPASFEQPRVVHGRVDIGGLGVVTATDARAIAAAILRAAEEADARQNSR